MRRSFIAVLAAGALTLSACGGNTDSGSEESPAAEATTSAAEATEAAPASVEVEDNNGKYTIAVPPKSVVTLPVPLNVVSSEPGPVRMGSA